MAKKFIEDFFIKDAKIFSTNFSGREKKDPNTGKIVNPEGKMTFCVRIPDDIAQDMTDDGWNVRISAPREEGDEPGYYMPVEVKYRDRSGRPLGNAIYPHIYMYVGRPGRKETELTEDSIKSLDGSKFNQIDLLIHPKNYIDDRTGEEKIKAYLLDGRFTLSESRMESLYAGYRDEEPEEMPFD